jgi:hypothetical protein
MRISKIKFPEYFLQKVPAEILKRGLNPILLAECSRLAKEEIEE